jgi:hypothetical protein
MFNTIYINNITEELNHSVIDATSITHADDLHTNNDITIHLPRYLKNHTKPYFILNGPCEWFGSWSDPRINFSGQTVDFFLYEVLYVWQNNSRYNCPVGVIEEDCVIKEFDMIDEWCAKHNCKYRILVNEYNMLPALQGTRYANWPIIHCDSFSLGHNPKNGKPSNSIPVDDDIKYKINCFTFRWDQHRMLAASFLLSREDIIITHFHRTSGSLIKWPYGDSEYYQRLINGKNLLDKVAPLTVEDFKPNTAFKMNEHLLPDNKGIHLTSRGLEEYFLKSFASLVCETNYEYPWGQLSEKFTNPVKQGNAFILLAGTHSLEQARSWGFKTFNKWWDESYDKETNPVKRMDAVFKVVDEVLNYSFDDLRQLRKDMMPVLVHNRNLVRTDEFKKNLTKDIL